MVGRWLGGWPRVFLIIPDDILDGWEMDERAPIVPEHSIQKRSPTHQNTRQYKQTPEPDGWVVGCTNFNSISVAILQ